MGVGCHRGQGPAWHSAGGHAGKPLGGRQGRSPRPSLTAGAVARPSWFLSRRTAACPKGRCLCRGAAEPAQRPRGAPTGLFPSASSRPSGACRSRRLPDAAGGAGAAGGAAAAASAADGSAEPLAGPKYGFRPTTVVAPHSVWTCGAARRMYMHRYISLGAGRAWRQLRRAMLKARGAEAPGCVAPAQTPAAAVHAHSLHKQSGINGSMTIGYQIQSCT